MSQFSSHLSRVLASAVVTAAALGGNAAVASCGAGTCGPKQATSRCRACSGKCGSAKVKAVKAKAESTLKCGAKCGASCAAATCGAKCGAKSGACAAK